MVASKILIWKKEKNFHKMTNMTSFHTRELKLKYTTPKNTFYVTLTLTTT